MARTEFTPPEMKRLMDGSDLKQAKEYAQATFGEAWREWLLDSGLVAPCRRPTHLACNCILSGREQQPVDGGGDFKESDGI